jgi:hypothetical protein
LRIVCKPIAISGFGSDCESTVVVSDEITSDLDRLDLNIRTDYYTSFNRANLVAYKASAEEYLFGEDEKWLDKSLLCPEMPVSHHLAPAIRLVVPTKKSWSKQGVAFIHAGREGCRAPVHFDWDHTWIAHACLLGRKKIFIFPPHSGWLLNPIINTSALDIPRFSECDRVDLINRLGGVEIELRAGEGICLPSMFWHGVLYEEPSLSVSVRFEPTPAGRPFAALPRSWLLQRLVWRFFQQGYGSEAAKFLEEYLESFFRPTKRWKNRYRQTVELCREALSQFGEQQGVVALMSDNFSSELALASEELKSYYGNAIESQESTKREVVQEVRDYIFRSTDHKPSAHELRLAVYALTVRQGLPPKRGLVTIEQE